MKLNKEEYRMERSPRHDGCEGCCFRFTYTDGCKQVREQVGDCTGDYKDGWHGTYVFKKKETTTPEPS